MDRREAIQAQLGLALDRTDLDGFGEVYRGKVRDVYRSGDRLLIVTTDRVSAFDHVLGTIPFKGEVLNGLAVHWFHETDDIVKNHVIDVPDPAVIVARRAEPFPVELVVRGYITGSLWRDYVAERTGAYGLPIPTGLRKDQKLDDGPWLTPSTKAAHGKHDEPISKARIVSSGLMTEHDLDAAERIAKALYKRGAERAAQRGLILADTKYELGKDENGHIILIDEIHTPDSSRYWLAEGYTSRFEAGEPQEMLDKETLREWLMARGFQGEGVPPALDDEIRARLAEQYLDLFSRITGRELELKPGDPRARIEWNLTSLSGGRGTSSR